MSAAAQPFTLWRDGLPRWLQHDHVTLRPGQIRSCAEPRLHRALVVVEHGAVTLTGEGGREVRLGEGAVFSVADIPGASLSNREARPALLSVARRAARGPDARSGADR